MIKLFKRNQPNIILFIIFIGILLWVPLFIFKPEQQQIDCNFSGIVGKLYQFLGARFFLRNFLSILLIITISLLLSRLNTSFLFINFRTHMPGFWFILLTAPFIYIFDLLPLLIASLFVVFSLYQLFESYDKKGLSFELIDAGVLISLGSIFYPPIILLHLYLLISLFILQDYSWKEWMLIIIGAIIPFAVMWSISYTFSTTFQTAYSDIFTRNENIFEYNLGNKIFLIAISIFLIIASFQMVSIFNLKKIKSRKLFSALLILFITSLIISIAFSRLSFLVIAILSLAYLFSHYFYLLKKVRLGNILFYLILSLTIFSIVNSIFPALIKF